MTRVKIIISGGKPNENKTACKRFCGLFAKGKVANPSSPVNESGAYSFWVDIDASLTENIINKTIRERYPKVEYSVTIVD